MVCIRQTLDLLAQKADKETLSADCQHAKQEAFKILSTNTETSNLDSFKRNLGDTSAAFVPGGSITSSVRMMLRPHLSLAMHIQLYEQ